MYVKVIISFPKTKVIKIFIYTKIQLLIYSTWNTFKVVENIKSVYYSIEKLCKYQLFN